MNWGVPPYFVFKFFIFFFKFFKNIKRRGEIVATISSISASQDLYLFFICRISYGCDRSSLALSWILWSQNVTSRCLLATQGSITRATNQLRSHALFASNHFRHIVFQLIWFGWLPKNCLWFVYFLGKVFCLHPITTDPWFWTRIFPNIRTLILEFFFLALGYQNYYIFYSKLKTE